MSILLTDRTTIETDWDCPRKRYWYKHHAGQGIVAEEEAIDLSVGIDIHSALARLVLGASAGSLIAAREWPEDKAGQEREQRHRGWLLAFEVYVLPMLRAWGSPCLVERETSLDHASLRVACTPDLTLVSPDQRLRVLDYKTTGILGKGWVDYWTYAPQLQINLAAVIKDLGWTGPAYAQVIGLDKGSIKYGRLNHPYVYGYVKGGVWLRAWAYGAEPVPTTEYPGGIEAWVAWLGEDVAKGQFPFSAPVYPNQRLLEDVLTSRLEREVDVAANKSNPLHFHRLFPMHTNRCRPAIGAPCAYIHACHVSGSVERNEEVPAGYVHRVPHHQMELDFLQEQADVKLAK